MYQHSTNAAIAIEPALEQPWLSVIIPTYNAEKYIHKTLQSLCAQDSECFEVIVIDDGSQDRTLEIVSSYAARLPIRIIEGFSTRNWVQQTNYAIRHARGEFISMLHQDDSWDPARIAALRSSLERYPQANVILHQAHYIDSNCKVRGVLDTPFPAKEGILDEALLEQALLVQNFIAISAVLIRRSVLGPEEQLLDDSLWYTADWKCWVDLSKSGPWLYIPKPLSRFRIHRESQTIVGTRIRGALDYLQQHLVVQENLLKQPGRTLPESLVRAARFSTHCNITLVSMLHGYRINWFKFFLQAVTLGPRGWFAFLRYSRIQKRLSARLKVHFDLRLA